MVKTRPSRPPYLQNIELRWNKLRKENESAKAIVDGPREPKTKVKLSCDHVVLVFGIQKHIIIKFTDKENFRPPYLTYHNIIYINSSQLLSVVVFARSITVSH